LHDDGAITFTPQQFAVESGGGGGMSSSKYSCWPETVDPSAIVKWKTNQ
jgi:hypothetical protein